ncbi:MAG TPA: DNA replication/repair protein RecF [Gammaproteobacteria bacterium]|jgi:DNA replication and repair protein RecF|nr:DNA replication/repair protein RecF [Gammaproteobacteria bacterium]
MTITSLQISNFRNLTSVQIAPAQQGLNIISGNNGSGKTSLLEAIFYLGHGKSFRSSVANRMINHQADKFSLFTQVVTELDRKIPLGVEREQTGSTRLRVDDKDVSSMAKLAEFLPIRMINSQSHQLLEAGPVFRRKYLDWGLFYQNADFITSWRQFERILKQRNAILRDKRPVRELESWTNELVKYGLELDQMRRAYIEKLLPHIRYFMQLLLSITELNIEYEPGWEKNQDYSVTLLASINDDYRIGHTQAGPHRADFEIFSDGIALRHILSRGQQKLLICAMILAQGLMLGEQEKAGLIYLVDDLPSELDSSSRQKLVSLLAMQKSQIFITAIENEAICELVRDNTEIKTKVFHVEHGKVVELIQ